MSLSLSHCRVPTVPRETTSAPYSWATEATAYSGDSCHPIRCKAATSAEGSLPPNPDESCTPSVPHRSAATPGFIRLRGGHVGFHGRMTFTHRLSSESNLVRVMEQAVKDRVSQGRIPQGLMP